ncbi:MAG: diaminopimelate decarboxylase [Acidimicrobiales bacterium]|nr:MAG: diaminopimelate decarboxylase [Acidimicrobiales bacterium]
MSGSLPMTLLPDSAEVGANGELIIGGCSVTALAEEYGTPLFIYDEAHLRSRAREAVAAFGPGVAYASKAFLCRAMARLVYEEGMDIDVSTAGEFHIARSAGVPAANLVYHGNNKSMRELREALREQVGRVVVDSFDELDRLEQLHAEGLPVPNVLLRVTPGVEAHTHEYISTGHDDSKFGFTVSSGLADQAIKRAINSPAMRLRGIHAHIGSQVFRVDSFAQASEVIAAVGAPYDLDEISVGGGLGVPYVMGEESATITQWANVVHDALDANGVKAKITAEPGRSIAAAAAVTVYTVGTIKHLEGIRTYVAVDGGMSDNPRPVLYGSGYESFLPRAVEAERDLEVRIVGKHCESGDLLVPEGSVPSDIVVGDFLSTPVTGAYGHSMGSNYNAVLRPPVLFVRDGEARIVMRRESPDDLMARDAT